MILRRMIVCIGLSLLLLNAHAAVFMVHPGQEIQAAIDKMKDGDTLLIKKGTYKQHNIVVNKGIAVIGEDFPVLDGQDKYEILFVRASNVLIKGIQVQNTGYSGMVDMAGIKIQDAAKVTVTGCKILMTTYGVFVQNSSYVTIEKNTISSNAVSELQAGNGVHGWKCSHLSVRNNSISGHRDGVYFEFVTDSHIEHNKSFKNIRYGLHFMFSHNDTYSHNTFSDNGAGVAVMYTKGVKMFNNTFYHNWGEAAYAILLKEISDSRVEGNKFIKNTVGINMEGGTRIHVSGNEFRENGWAFRITASSTDNVIEKNNFLSNSFDVATNGTMMLNRFSRNYWDKYDGYDLDRNGAGDVPYYPVSVYSVITEKIPTAMILYRSFLTNILDQVEKLMPSIIPDQLKDDEPEMKKWKL